MSDQQRIQLVNNSPRFGTQEPFDLDKAVDEMFERMEGLGYRYVEQIGDEYIFEKETP